MGHWIPALLSASCLAGSGLCSTTSMTNTRTSRGCLDAPSEAQDVATIVKTAKQHQCPFAVKGGGHSFFEGASSIEGGISVDLQRLNQVTPNDDGTIASVGPGNRWGRVYEALSPLNKIVVGGRISTVGVGGLLLSGGLSFLHPQRGFACDNIRSYQLVNAHGEILEVNDQSYPDLFWALRGGGSNFGIVTRFDLDTIPQGNFWGGIVQYNISALDPLMQAYDRLAQPGTEDVKATTWIVPVYSPKTKSYTLATLPTYTNPVNTTPSIFEPVLSAPGKLTDTIRLANLSSLSRDYETSPGRHTYEWNIVMKFNTEVAGYIKARLDEGAMAHPTLDSVLFPLQVLPQSTLGQMKKRRGGNALGLSAEDGPLLIVQIALGWAAESTAMEDAEILEKGGAFIDELKEWSVERGLDHRYIYKNYAGAEQDVFAGYGEGNRAGLKWVARKYDPEGVFQTLVPGGHKLF